MANIVVVQTFYIVMINEYYTDHLYQFNEIHAAPQDAKKQDKELISL